MGWHSVFETCYSSEVPDSWKVFYPMKWNESNSGVPPQSVRKELWNHTGRIKLVHWIIISLIPRGKKSLNKLKHKYVRNTKVTKIIFQSVIDQVAVFLPYYFSLNSNQQNHTGCMDISKNLILLSNNWVNWAVFSRLMARQPLKIVL